VIGTLARSARPPFLVITPVCVGLGASVVVMAGGALEWWLLAVALAGALLAHVAVNALNEYHDFTSGLDLETARTPFSGGSGALPADPGADGAVLWLGITAAAATAGIGLVFVARHGWGIVPFGVLGLAIVLTYTPWINRRPVLCLLAPGAGIGLLMVAGTQYALEGVHRPEAWLASVVPFLLGNNLLLLNQYPDIDADAAAGRRHFVIIYGVRPANIVYGVSASAVMATIVAGVVSGLFPVAALIALLPLALALAALAGAVRHGRGIGDHPGYLAANAAAALLTPLFLALTFAASGA